MKSTTTVKTDGELSHGKTSRRSFLTASSAAVLGAGRLLEINASLLAAPIEGSAYGAEFTLHRHLYSAIESLRGSEAMRSVLGSNFVDLYCLVKDDEYREFQEIITPWEREILMFNV